MFAIFISESALKAIVLSESKKPAASQSFLYKIMRELKKLYVSAESSDTSWGKQFKDKYGWTLDFSQSDYIKGIPAHPETILQHPSSVFILNIPITEAERIQRSYGVICLSSEMPSLAMLIDTNDEHTISEGEVFGNGWETVLKSFKDIPSNALLLTDRYLFSFYSARMGDGVANVKSILNALLPQRFLGEYHVIIIFDDDKLHSNFTFSYIASRLEDIKQELHREYPIVIELLGITSDCEIYEQLHNRRIISNYFIVKAEHKLAAFNGNKGTALQSITPQVLFTVDSLNHRSSPPLKSIDHLIAALRKFSQSLPRLKDHHIYSYAIDGEKMSKCKGIVSRLLK